MKLWVRMGDADDYHDFNNLNEVAEHFAEYHVEEVERIICGFAIGVTASGFEGYNCISLFWGENDEPECIRPLTDKEIEELNKRLLEVNHVQ